MVDLSKLSKDAVGLRLYRHDKQDNLIGCEYVRFISGYAAVHTVLRRAAISGKVEVDGQIVNQFAEALDADGSCVNTIIIDALQPFVVA